jgi:glycosyltransferase involved in cell wall biosynthesis
MKKFRLVVDYEDKQSLLTPKKLRRFMLLLEKLSFVYADIMLCASSFLADEYCKKSRCEAFYLPYGLNYREVKGSQISYYADDFKEIKVAYLGNLVFPYKEQFDFLIEAFPHVKQFINKCSLHIIGEGPMRSYINERIRDLGLKESVTFHGYVHDERLLSLLGSMDVLVLPFADVPVNRYRCPNKVFIYAQTGLPIVTNQVGEVFSVMKNYPRAYFYLENNVKSFCDTLKKAITTKGTYDLTQFYLSQSWEMITKNYLKIINRQLLS